MVTFHIPIYFFLSPPRLLQVLFSCLLAFAAAAPHPESSAETVVDERSDNGDGNFNYRFETTNGISERRSGAPGSEGQSNMEGAYR